MIQKTNPFQNLSPISAPVAAKKPVEVSKDPTDGWVGGIGAGPSLPDKGPEHNAERLRESGHSNGLKIALGLTGLAVAGVSLLSATPAQAQVQHARTNSTSSRSLTDMLKGRDTTPVRVRTVQEAVNQFSAERQIYVVGNPQYQGQTFNAETYREFEEVYKEHPNAYIVLIAESDNVKADDMALSKGIANHPEFTGQKDKETGESNASVVMIYFKVTDQRFIQQTGKDRAIYMRSEQLLDDAGVGENSFVDRETLEPRELMQKYVDVVRNNGTVPQAMNAVLTRIDQGIETHVSQTVRGARTQVDGAETALKRVKNRVDDFQDEHGKEGTLGSPPVADWEGQLRSAKDAVKNKNYGQASEIARNLQTTIANYETQLSQFEQAPQTAQELRNVIQALETQLETLESNAHTQRAQEHVASARQSLASFQERFDANELDFQPQLQQTREHATSAQSEINASRSSEAAARNLKLYGSAAVGVALLVTGVVLNMRARKGKAAAQDSLDKAIGVMGDRSKALIDIMNQADVSQIASFTGTTQKMAQQLLASTADALALMGGGQNVINDARDLIKGENALGRLKNMFATGNFDKAVGLLTDAGQQVPFELADSKQLDLEKGSRAEAWREHLLQGVVSKPQQESFLQMLDKLQSLAGTNSNMTEILLRESKEVGAYLDTVKGSGLKAQDSSLELQEQGKEDQLFIAPSVTKRLLAAVLGEQGLIAKGHEVKGTDPFRARQEFGEPSERMIADANTIVELGGYARSTTLPAIAAADAALHPHQIATDWAHFKKEELSLQLDRTGEKAVEIAVESNVDSLQDQLKALETRLGSVVALDKERWEVAQPQIKEAEQAVATAREGLCSALQAAGVFQGGKPEQVLREPDRDPSKQLYESRQNYEAIKPLLDEGNVDQPPTHLQNVASLTSAAHQLVNDSREAFANYPNVSNERRTRRESMIGSIPQTFEPSLQRIGAGYTSAAQKSVAAEVSHAGTSKVETVGDYLESTHQLIDRAESIQDAAQHHYETAFLLTSRDELNQIDRILIQGQSNLDAITKAERVLGSHQANAETDLTALTGRIGQTADRSKAVYVRAKAKQLLAQVQQELEKARPVVFQKPASPYEAHQTLKAVEALRTQVENTISFDKAAYDAANAAIDGAKQLIASADADIEKAARTGWTQSISGYGTVQHAVDPSDLSGAKSTVSTSRQELSAAESMVGPQDYEKAQAQADQSQQTSRRAKTEVQRVVDAAQAVFRQKVAAGTAIAEASSELDQAARELDRCASESWSQYVSDFGQVQHSVSHSDISAARSILENGRQELSSAKSAVQSENFDRAKSLAEQAERRAGEAITEARRAVERQKDIYEAMLREAHECVEAKQMIRQAESNLRSAETEISNAGRQSWSQHVSGHGTVSHAVSSSDLSTANSYLNNARSDISQANSYLNSRNYSSAQSEARSASSNAERAENEAESVVSRERSEFDRKVREAQASVPPPGGGGGSGGGGGTGGGGGGGVGGGGSGSTGGGW